MRLLAPSNPGPGTSPPLDEPHGLFARGDVGARQGIIDHALHVGLHVRPGLLRPRYRLIDKRLPLLRRKLRGVGEFTLTELARIAHALGVKPADLLPDEFRDEHVDAAA